MQTKRENRGGARSGTGPKKKALSYSQVQEALGKATEYAEKHGVTVDEILLDFVYNQIGDITSKDRLAAIKLWKDCTRVPITEGSDADKELGPSVYLPERRPDPAKIVQLKEA